MSSKFSNEDRLGWESDEDLGDFIENQLELDPEEDLLKNGKKKLDFDAIAHYLNRIPDREADLITLYYKDKMKQEQIARLFGITQAAVSYRLHRGIKRIQFLRTIPELNTDEFELELGPKFNDQDREILWRMYKTTCQSEIAKQMGLTQGRVRHRFFRALGRIKDLIAEEVREKQAYFQMVVKQEKSKEIIEEAKEDLDQCINNSKYSKYWKVFHAISDKHFNLLHEVKFPQFADRGDAQVLPVG
jgi:DNA-directed RNA polymerase specialized sigma24 family protein